MAEIRVEPKRRSLAWLWVLLALAVVAVVAWYLMNGGVQTAETSVPPTSLAAPVAPAPVAALGAPAAPVA